MAISLLSYHLLHKHSTTYNRTPLGYQTHCVVKEQTDHLHTCQWETKCLWGRSESYMYLLASAHNTHSYCWMEMTGSLRHHTLLFYDLQTPRVLKVTLPSHWSIGLWSFSHAFCFLFATAGNKVVKQVLIFISCCATVTSCWWLLVD
jgi:hypothetical protein